MTWRWFPRPDPTDPTLIAVLELDGRPPLLELHIHDGFAVWLTERGRVLLVIPLWRA
jgi:hypothetical protein